MFLTQQLENLCSKITDFGILSFRSRDDTFLFLPEPSKPYPLSFSGCPVFCPSPLCSVLTPIHAPSRISLLVLVWVSPFLLPLAPLLGLSSVRTGRTRGRGRLQQFAWQALGREEQRKTQASCYSWMSLPSSLKSELLGVVLSHSPNQLCHLHLAGIGRLKQFALQEKRSQGKKDEEDFSAHFVFILAKWLLITSSRHLFRPSRLCVFCVLKRLNQFIFQEERERGRMEGSLILATCFVERCTSLRFLHSTFLKSRCQGADRPNFSLIVQQRGSLLGVALCSFSFICCFLLQALIAMKRKSHNLRRKRA